MPEDTLVVWGGEFGYNVVQDPVHVHDFHATLLHLLGSITKGLPTNTRAAGFGSPTFMDA